MGVRVLSAGLTGPRTVGIAGWVFYCVILVVQLTGPVAVSPQRNCLLGTQHLWETTVFPSYSDARVHHPLCANKFVMFHRSYIYKSKILQVQYCDVVCTRMVLITREIVSARDVIHWCRTTLGHYPLTCLYLMGIYFLRKQPTN